AARTRPADDSYRAEPPPQAALRPRVSAGGRLVRLVVCVALAAGSVAAIVFAEEQGKLLRASIDYSRYQTNPDLQMYRGMSGVGIGLFWIFLLMAVYQLAAIFIGGVVRLFSSGARPRR